MIHAKCISNKHWWGYLTKNRYYKIEDTYVTEGRKYFIVVDDYGIRRPYDSKLFIIDFKK